MLTRHTETPGERAALLWSFLCFFALLSGYYVIRPLRDAVNAGIGPDGTLLVFNLAFGVMLVLVPAYGALVARQPRRRFLPLVFVLVMLTLAGFSLAWRDAPLSGVLAVGFAMFVTVFNLFVVSVFWSFMADIFDTQQAKRLFGVIAAGGTCGALVGPLLTRSLVQHLQPAGLLWVSISLFGVVVLAITQLIPWARAMEARSTRQDGEQLIGGGILAGAQRVFQSRYLGSLALLTLVGVSIGTLLYYLVGQQARIAFPDQASRTSFFASVDLAVNAGVLFVQLLLVRPIMLRFGLAPLLLIPGTLICLGFFGLALASAFLWLVAVQVVTRGSNFALMQPAKETLFTATDREARYKVKTFIDTACYRAGDVSMGWVMNGLFALGLGLSAFAWVGLGLGLCFLAICAWVNHLRQQPCQMSRAQDPGQALP